MAEPTKLLSAEEFRKGFIQMNPVAVHDLCYAALARVAELEAERDAWGSARLPAIERERDALAAELAELRAATDDWAWRSEHTEERDGYARLENAEQCLRNLVAQPQGERGKALLAALTEIAHYGVSVPLEMTQAQYDAHAARDMRRIAQTAIDGAQP